MELLAVLFCLDIYQSYDIAIKHVRVTVSVDITK